MDNGIGVLISAILTALAVENVVFARALGLNKSVMFIGHPKTGILYGALLTWLVTVASVFVALLHRLLAGQGPRYFLAPAYLACTCAVYTFTYLFTQKKMPALFVLISRALPVSTFNSALFGVFFITNNPGYSILQTIGYAFGAGVGYTLAILIIYYARKRLAISPVPRSFRGLPILLLYIGILSLAIYGLIGHGLPI